MKTSPDTIMGQSVYECLGCGAIVEAETHPLKCEDCGGLFHDRSTPRE